MIMQFDWNDVPPRLMVDYQERIKLVETLLDDSVDWVVKKDIREEYCLDHGVTDRTIRNYIAWYKREGPGDYSFTGQLPRLNASPTQN